MSQTQELKLVPGSPEARAQGCTCGPPKGDTFFINETCPMHWYMLQVGRTNSIFKFTTTVGNQLRGLYCAIIVAALILGYLFLTSFAGIPLS